jgi:hypothetical protein
MYKTLLSAGGVALVLTQLGQAAQPGLPPANPHYPWHRSYTAVIDQTAAVVTGLVTNVNETYNEREGPRTLVTLSSLAVLWGSFDASTVTLKMFGGTVPGHRGRVDETHIPTFVDGKRYVVFLSNRDWRLSPVTARQAYLIERVHSKDLVVTFDGHAVFGIDDIQGPSRSFAVYRIPDEVEEDFVPTVDASITPAMLTRGYSVGEFASALRTWGSRRGIAVHGTFNDQPYSTGNWRIIAAAPDRSTTAAALAGPSSKMFAPQAGRVSRPVGEPKACGGDAAVPLDRDPRDRSRACEEGGVR